MPVATYNAWLSLYAGVGLLVGICAVAAIIKTIHDLHSRDLVLDLLTWKGRVTALPRLWWRWQVNYLSGAPAILLTALLFAHHIGFEVLVDV